MVINILRVESVEGQTYETLASRLQVASTSSHCIVIPEEGYLSRTSTTYFYIPGDGKNGDRQTPVIFSLSGTDNALTEHLESSMNGNKYGRDCIQSIVESVSHMNEGVHAIEPSASLRTLEMLLKSVKCAGLGNSKSRVEEVYGAKGMEDRVIELGNSLCPEYNKKGVLTTDSEKQLFTVIQGARYFLRTKYYELVRSGQVSQKTIERISTLFYIAEKAREEITRGNTAIVLKLAKRSKAIGIELDEFISEGNMAFMDCIDNFDVTRGYKLSTYLFKAIPKRFKKVFARIAKDESRTPLPEEFVDLSTGRNNDEAEAVRHVLDTNSAALSPRSLRCLRLRYGITQGKNQGDEELTFEAIGKIMGTTLGGAEFIVKRAGKTLKPQLRRALAM